MQQTTPIRPANNKSNSGFPFHAPSLLPHNGSPYSPSESIRDVKMPAIDSPLSERTLVDEPLSNADHALDYGMKRDALATAIDASVDLVKSFDEFNSQHWSVQYRSEWLVPTTTAAPPTTSSCPSTPRKLHRAQSTLGGETISSPLKRPDHARAFSTMAHVRDTSEKDQPANTNGLAVLSIDLKLGTHATGPASLPALLESLSQDTLAQMLSRKLASTAQHLSTLKTRVQDVSSKVLVTGDLNAGKSTFVNALLQRELLPVDQQPCTTVFSEVLDAKAHNDGKEEVHAVRKEDLARYSASDPSTYTSFGMDQLDAACIDGEDDFALVKIYVNDTRADEEALAKGESSPSFVRNGLVSISLIDAPGLNRDTLSTTAVFARQDEIDVIVFVVSAENHFTLSAKEFLWTASREKAYVFVVVNKFAGIRDKKRCERLVGEQIRQLSPATWDNKSELVHFVDAASSLSPTPKDEEDSFTHLETSLRSFVLLKRAKSKLAPAKHYLLNLLTDLGLLAEANSEAAEAELVKALADLEKVRPMHERLLRLKEQVEDSINSVEEVKVEDSKKAALNRLDRALACIGLGQIVPATQSDLPTSFDAPTELPAYPGVLGIWQWADDVKAALLSSLEGQRRLAEEEARKATVGGVAEITGPMAKRFLPEEQQEMSEGRVFKPEVMFAKRRRAMTQASKPKRTAEVGLGLASSYYGLENGAMEISVLDLFDLERLLPFKGKQLADESEAEAAGALSVVSLGVGAVTMFGSRAIGVKGLVDSVARVCEVFGSPQARKWAGPVIGVLTAGLAVYIIVDLPRAVPRNIGRKLQLSLTSTGDASAQAQSYTAQEADRISKETRKVLRMAGWDLRERFRAALEKSEQERKQVEGTRDKAVHAIEWFGAFAANVETEEANVREVDLES